MMIIYAMFKDNRMENNDTFILGFSLVRGGHNETKRDHVVLFIDTIIIKRIILTFLKAKCYQIDSV